MQTVDFSNVMFLYMFFAATAGAIIRVAYASRREPRVAISYSVAGAMFSMVIFYYLFDLLGRWAYTWTPEMVYNPLLMPAFYVLVVLAFTASYGMVLLIHDFLDAADRYQFKRTEAKIRLMVTAHQPLSTEQQAFAEEHRLVEVPAT